MSRNDDGGRDGVGNDEGGSNVAAAGQDMGPGGAQRDDWAKVSAFLRRTLSEDAFQRWFREARLERSQENVATLFVPTETHVLWIEANYMPELEAFFHYRNLDVSSVKELARRWKPDILSGLRKQGTHQAMEDIKDSVEELRYYREHFIQE